MSVVKIRSAVGNAPELNIVAAQLIDLGTLDTNRVHVIAPSGPQITIQSFGAGPEAILVTKRIRWDAGIKLKNSATLRLLESVDHVTELNEWAIFNADANSVWREEKRRVTTKVQTWVGNDYSQSAIVLDLMVIIPSGYQTAFWQLVGAGGMCGVSNSAGAGGSYCEKTYVGLIPGRTFHLQVGMNRGNPAGSWPTKLLSGTFDIGSGLTAGAGNWSSTGLGFDINPSGAPSSGGDFMITTPPATVVPNVSVTTPANPLTPAQIATTNQALNGLDYGGGGIMCGPSPAPAGNGIGRPGAARVTWRQ